MEISVVVRTLGRVQRLVEALESLADQTFRRFEAVVVDMSGGAAQPALDHCRRRLPHLQHLQTNRRLIRPIALNHAIERSSGHIITVLDDDNRYEPGHLQTLWEGLSESNADLVYTGVRRETFTPDGTFLQADVFQPKTFDYGRLLIENFIYTSSIAFRKSVWQRVGGYDPRFPVYEDWDFLIRVGQVGRIQPIEGSGAVSRSFTGKPGVPEHHAEIGTRDHCWVGLMWLHRQLRRKWLRDRGELLEGEGRHIPRHGVRRGDIRLLLEWGWRYRRDAQEVRQCPV